MSQSLAIKNSINPHVFVDDIYSHVHKPLDPNAWPKIRSDKTICRLIVFKLSKEHENKWEAKHALQAIIFPLVQVPPSRYGFICNIKSSMGKTKGLIK
jgi:hypothetical protein